MIYLISYTVPLSLHAHITHSQVQLLPEAAVYVPDDESVETIGRSYTFSGEEERSFVPLKKRGDKSSDREGGEDRTSVHE